MSYLAQKSVNAFLVLGQTGGRGYESPLDISYLADTVIRTSYFEQDGENRVAIAIHKRRTGRHDRGLRELVFEPGGLRVEVVTAATSGGSSDFGTGNTGGVM
jgi:circadian clock protein KaiC